MKKSLIQTVSGGAGSEGHLQIGTYTGGGSSDVSISGLGFQPDAVAIRNIDATSSFSYWIDGNRRAQYVGQAGRDYIYAPDFSNYITYDSDGFTVSTNSGASNVTNNSGDEFLYYAWYLDGNAGDTNGSDEAGFFIGKFGGTGGTGLAFFETGLSSVIFTFASGGYLMFLNDGGNQDAFGGNQWQHASQGWSANHTNTAIKSFRNNPYGFFGAGNVDGVSKTGYYNGGNSGSSNEITVGFSPRILMVVRDPGTSVYPYADKMWWWTTAIDSNTVKYTRYRSGDYNAGKAGKVTSQDSGFGVTFTDTGFYWDSASESQTNASGSRYTYWAKG